MKHVLLGSTGLWVSELCLGTMLFGAAPGSDTDVAAGRAVLQRYAEAGGNFFDTANAYQLGGSEELLGRFLGAERDRFVVATKYTRPMRPDDPNAGGNSRKSLVQALDASLRRLGTNYVDLLQIHLWDFGTSIEEVLRALDDQVRLGKVLHVGVSNTPAWVVARGNALAEVHGWSPFVTIQEEYSLLERNADRELLPMARATGISALAHSPLAGGVLTGKYRDTPAGLGRGRRFDTVAPCATARSDAIAAEVVAVAAELGATPSQVALAWLRQRPPTIIPVIGARTEAQLDDNLGSLSVVLPADAVARLDRISAIDGGTAHRHLTQTEARHVDDDGVVEIVAGRGEGRRGAAN